MQVEDAKRKDGLKRNFCISVSATEQAVGAIHQIRKYRKRSTCEKGDTLSIGKAEIYLPVEHWRHAK